MTDEMPGRGVEPGNDERVIPATPMGDRYLDVHAGAPEGVTWKRGQRTARQRELAEQDLGDVSLLADDFIKSVAQFEAYRPRDPEFHPDRNEAALKRWHNRGNPVTSRLAAWIKYSGIEVRHPLPEVSYVDRELVPSRTTGKRDFKKAHGTRVRLDLLFALDRRPVVAEVKALSDENAYYALIQGLAVSAQLAPRAQRARLSSCYSTLDESGPMELWIVLASHNSRGQDKAALVDLSRHIAGGLLEDKRVSELISRIACVDATISARGPVVLKEHWQCEARSGS